MRIRSWIPSLGLVAGCTAEPFFASHHGEGGAPATSTGEGGDLFDTAIGASCCLDLGPFDGLSYFTEGDAPCPEGTTEGLTLHADLMIEPHTCTACSCSPAPCSLPAGMHAHAAKCPGDNATALPFGPVAGWDGTCSTQDAIPADIPCDGGVPCVQSLTIPAVIVSPCEPSVPEASLPALTWGRTVRECKLDLAAEACEPGQVCVRAPPEDGKLCLHVKGDHPQCPPGYERSVFYQGAKDERDCEECECGAPVGMQCEALVSVYTDGTCSSLGLATTVGTGGPECVDVLSGAALGSTEAAALLWMPGSCAASGGAPVGDAAPVGPFTLCCPEEPGPAW